MLASVGSGDLAARACLELASGLAHELGKGILVVDAAPSERHLSTLLHCAGRTGLTDALFDSELPLGEIVLPTTHPNVAFVAAGAHTNPVEFAVAERIGRLLEVFQRDHEIVLLCGGIVPTNALALALAPLVGCVLLLATEDETMIEDLEAAQEALRIRKTRDVGVILATRSGEFA
jgi:MinD-like ATPase involved in chromosome partitioning or flagellar assembly